jgi:parallel beta-helix repeat protein
MDLKYHLGVFFCLLLVVSSSVSLSASSSQRTLPSLNGGSILYVGGVGPNNYTRIQDAINDSVDGDTVFVCDDSSPYIEHVVVDKSITLQGEEKNSTVLLGVNLTYGVNITADEVSVSGFTIQNFHYGVYLMSSNCWVSENIFRDNSYGLLMFKSLPDPVPFSLGFNVVRKNVFINNSQGIFAWVEWNNTIEENMIYQCTTGISVGSAVNTIVSLNHLSENEFGVVVYGSYNTTVFQNNFTANNISVVTMGTSADAIRQNNFFNNNWSALSSQRILMRIRLVNLYLGVPLHRNVWDGNYWDEPRSSPYMIPSVFVRTFYVINIGLQFDWHPAQEPYDIPGMSL